MHRVGSIKVKPFGWKDIFFPDVHHLPGSWDTSGTKPGARYYNSARAADADRAWRHRRIRARAHQTTNWRGQERA